MLNVSQRRKEEKKSLKRENPEKLTAFNMNPHPYKVYHAVVRSTNKEKQEEEIMRENLRSETEIKTFFVI